MQNRPLRKPRLQAKPANAQKSFPNIFSLGLISYAIRSLFCQFERRQPEKSIDFIFIFELLYK
jgi:hypothetical protein